MSKEIEDALGAMGFEVTSGEVPQGTSLDAPSFEPPQGSDVLDFSALTQQPSSEPSAEPTTEPPVSDSQEPQLNQGQVIDQSSLQSPEPEMSDEEFEMAVANYVSERLGVSVDSLDALNQMLNARQAAEIDERVKAIADFVAETGRDPQDWFTYQSINPSEMDDLSAVRLQLAVDYPNLSGEEVELLVSSKYKLDSNIYSEDEIKLSTLQLKIDADKAKQGIQKIRESYKAPVRPEGPDASIESPIDDQWIATMSREVDELEAISFDLQGQEFNFALKDDYKNQLKQKNVNIDQFFDQYVDEGGNWNFEMLNVHRALVDNIDEIVKSIYNQGLSDGQRKLVEKAANVDVSSPKVAPASTTDNVAQQIYNHLYGDNGLRIKI
jgi:hypothetical protein